MNGSRKLIPLLVFTCILSGQSLHLKRRAIESDTRSIETLETPGPRWTSGRSHLILQFHHTVNDQIIQQLNQQGAFVVGTVPDFGVAVSAPDDFAVEGLDVAWAGRLDAADKISRFLEKPLAEPETWFVAEFFPDVDMREARRMAEAAGFRVHRHPDLLKSHLLLSGDPGRLTGLAQWDEVAYLFPASHDLIHGVHVMHCAGALTTGGVTGTYATSGSGWPKDASGQVTLSYVFGPLTPKLDASQTTQELLLALKSWAPYAPINFVAGQSATAPRTVYISFVQYDHGDGYPFDGPGGILAHTFYPAPPNAESIAGDMHFDGSENWHIGADTDLFSVAMHESGHALGLAHVDDPAALMYPYYRLGSKIAADDIAGVQALYGPAGSTPGAVSTAPLTLTISTPSTNTTTTSAALAVGGTTSGAIGTVKITWQTDHGASGTASGSTQWSIASVPLTLGSNTITVTAADSSRKSVQTVTVTRSAGSPAPVTTSQTPPTITITSPSGTVINTSVATITLKGTASDNIGVTKVTWQAPWGSANATGTTSWTASAIPLLLGNNIITVRAYNAAGNQAARSILVIRK
jgi:hypothetical protein